MLWISLLVSIVLAVALALFAHAYSVAHRFERESGTVENRILVAAAAAALIAVGIIGALVHRALTS